MKPETPTQLQERLHELGACEEARIWAQDKTPREAWEQCERGDWLLWWAKKEGVDLQTLTLAKAKCAETVIHLMKDERSKKAIQVAIAFGEGKATRDELNAAAAAAYAAYTAYTAAYAAYTAYTAAYVAAYASAAYAADAAAYAAYTAYTAYTAAYVAAAGAKARKENQLKTANIVRQIIKPNFI